MPFLTASKATAAGSAPSRSERTVSTPTRAPQVASWSAAAARKRSEERRVGKECSARSQRRREKKERVREEHGHILAAAPGMLHRVQDARQERSRERTDEVH